MEIKYILFTILLKLQHSEIRTRRCEHACVVARPKRRCPDFSLTIQLTLRSHTVTVRPILMYQIVPNIHLLMQRF